MVSVLSLFLELHFSIHDMVTEVCASHLDTGVHFSHGKFNREKGMPDHPCVLAISQVTSTQNNKYATIFGGDISLTLSQGVP